MTHMPMSVNYHFYCVFGLKARMFYNGCWLVELLCGGERFSGLWHLPVVLFVSQLDLCLFVLKTLI